MKTFIRNEIRIHGKLKTYFALAAPVAFICFAAVAAYGMFEAMAYFYPMLGA